MNAFTYSRFSTDNQSEASIEDQQRVCRDFAAARGWTIAAEFADEGISGGAMGNRPGVQAALSALTVGDVLLVADTTRLSRSQDLAPLVARLKFRGVRVLGVHDGFDSESPHARMQAGLSGIMSEEMRANIAARTHSALAGRAKQSQSTGGKSYGYRLRVMRDDSRQDRYGEPLRIGSELSIDPQQAAVVREIFENFVAGESMTGIAAELNRRNVPSPGSTWNRKVRRCGGWMNSAVRVIVRNPIYTGRVRWNTSQTFKDPELGRRVRRARPQSEWIERHDEALRIVPDALFDGAQKRMSGRGVPSAPLKRQGRQPKYLLSGLLRCTACDANYVMADARSYACSSHWNGKGCTNTVRVRRDHLEEKLLGSVREDLLAPESLSEMAKQLRSRFQAYTRDLSARALDAPKEIRDQELRIGRLRTRLAAGDPDITADELSAAIQVAEGKLETLRQAQPAAKQSARLLHALPRAAEEIRTEITAALAGNERSLLRARAALRKLFNDRIDLTPAEGGGLMARYAFHPEALLVKASGIHAGWIGSGGRI